MKIKKAKFKPFKHQNNMIIESLETLKKIIPTIVGGDFEIYRQHIINTEAWLENRILGTKLFENIKEEKDSLFYKSMQVIAAYKSYLDAIPGNDVVETSRGFAVVNDDTFAPASTARVKALIDSIAKSLNDALALFIDAIEAKEDKRNLWKDSSLFSMLYSTYIPAISIYQQYTYFDGLYLDFLSIAPQLQGSMFKEIAPHISDELLDEILTELREDNLSDSNKTIIGDLRTSLVAYSKGNTGLADSCLFSVRRKLEADPEKFPAFKDSTLYAKLQQKRERDPRHKSILTVI